MHPRVPLLGQDNGKFFESVRSVAISPGLRS